MIGIVCGIEAEARIARQLKNSTIVCAGARPDRARAQTKMLCEQGINALISFGIAGALSPEAKLGDLVIGTHVISEKGQWNCNPAWIEALRLALPFAVPGKIYGSETLVPTAAAKEKLYLSSGSLSVDMESQAMAEIATHSNVPFIVLRSICDDATMDVPPLVMDAVDADGKTNIKLALRSLSRNPSQLGAILHVMRGTSKALATLQRAVPLIQNLS